DHPVQARIAGFEAESPRRYGADAGYAAAGFAITGLRVRGRGPVRPLAVDPGGQVADAPPPHGTRAVRFHGRGGVTADVPIYGADAVRPGCVLDGPAIVELPDTSIVVPDGARCRIDGQGSARIALFATD